MTDADHYRLLAKIPTAIGAKTAGYYGKQGKGFELLLSSGSSSRQRER
jgi:hypothetical protein